ncbi:fatty acid oxidation complex subunit alpha FadB [Entomomonas asaccharolytica]|uniref:enoyl-CoA hydratase n=1 Tax=Entomomonas asaccharolytica TaxID=2785331 RepID=A0A974RXU5_9GAMM|nr:fatty acid oxidation complex subunit alpha FadB [Entomomonas asaccharolytica]QQP86613.1 fatty acid oxidation complex subunit alpha FadB [Entomomonas asaccharolytica]
MIYSGKNIKVLMLENNIAELNFDATDSSVNKFDTLTLQELQQAVTAIKAEQSIQGLLITSSKDTFVVGADITEFIPLFREPVAKQKETFTAVHTLFNEIEDLPYPTISVINGLALGGGLEIALTTDFRVMSTTAQIGFPEVGLGICPGYGGTVRSTRLIGLANALTWMTTGKNNKAAVALQLGAVNAVAENDQLKEVAIDLLRKAIKGEIDYTKHRQVKLDPVQDNEAEQQAAFKAAEEANSKMAANYPAVGEIISLLKQNISLPRDKALSLEVDSFIKLGQTDVAASLIGLFMNEQVIKRKAKAYVKKAQPVNYAAVLGAGIMGGGIAYQSAATGTPIFMKDINDHANELGMAEANNILSKNVKRGKFTEQQKNETLQRIHPTLSYDGFDKVDVVIEAVVESPKVKKMVLPEVEASLKDTAIVTSNTSTISINLLAESVKRPENFCGMHFFNPVHAMKLVEVIRGEKTTENTIATIVAYAQKMGKAPIVVNDCPGFLVNRVLFPYLGGLESLIADGADFVKVDKVMEAFGWPMGPAYLSDVIGMDTCWHCQEVLSDGFPDRMKKEGEDAIAVLYKAERLGQKNGKGFYVYSKDDSGRPKKEADSVTYDLLKPLVKQSKEISDQEILERMMVPFCMETVRSLEEGIVETAAEADMAILYGLGFPRFRGGALRYIDTVGVANFVAIADKYKNLGAIYHATVKLREMAKTGQRFFD